MKTAAEILKSKAKQAVHTIAPGDSVFDAVKLMADKNIGALLVMEADRIAGIVTERDYARKIVLMSRSSKETPVREIMTAEVMYVHRPDQRRVHGVDDRKPAPPSASHRRRQTARAHLHRGPGEEHHFGAEIHHRAARALHLRRERLTPTCGRH